MNLYNLLKDKSRHSIRIAIVSLMFLVFLLPPASIVRAYDEELVFPNFEEADCDCPELISKFHMTAHRIYYDKDGMQAMFKMEEEGQTAGILNQKTGWCRSPQGCQDARDAWFDTTHDWAWIKEVQKVKEAIEQGRGYKIIELDEDIEDSRVSLVYLDNRSRCFGSRKFTYEDTFSVGITHDGFRDMQKLIDAMNELEECIRAVLKRKMQEMGARETEQEEYTEEPALIEDTPQPSREREVVMGIVRSMRRAEVRRSNSDTWIPLRVGTYLGEGDEVRTLQGGYCNIGGYIRYLRNPKGIILMQDNSYLRMPTMDDLNRPPYWSWEAIKGRFYTEMKELIEDIFVGEVKIKTPNALGGIVGTEFEIIVEEDGTSIFNVIDGIVEVSDLNGTRTVTVSAGETTICESGGLPSDPQSLDIDSLEKWWESFPDETEMSEGDGSFNAAVIIVSVVLISAIATVAIIFLRRRR